MSGPISIPAAGSETLGGDLGASGEVAKVITPAGSAAEGCR